MENTYSLSDINEFIYMLIAVHSRERARQMDGPGTLGILLIELCIFLLWAIGTYFAMLVLVHFPRILRLLLVVWILAGAVLVVLQAHYVALLVLVMIAVGYIAYINAMFTTPELMNSLYPSRSGARPFSKYQKLLEGG
jgi:hypothetical protein